MFKGTIFSDSLKPVFNGLFDDPFERYWQPGQLFLDSLDHSVVDDERSKKSCRFNHFEVSTKLAEVSAGPSEFRQKYPMVAP